MCIASATIDELCNDLNESLNDHNAGGLDFRFRLLKVLCGIIFQYTKPLASMADVAKQLLTAKLRSESVEYFVR